MEGGKPRMSRFVKPMSRKAGLPPGTAVHVGTKRVDKPRFTAIRYDQSSFEESESAPEECCAPADEARVTWINVEGVHQEQTIETLGQRFALHPLVVEDIVNTAQRPKMEEYGDYVFVVLKALYSGQDADLSAEQVSMVLGKDWVLSFEERAGDVFEPIRARLRTGGGRIRKMGADYLLYCLLDAIVDNYFVVLERLGDRIEVLEENLLADPAANALQQIHSLRGDTIFLRKSVWPLREVVSRLARAETALVSQSTATYFRDVYDHTIQVMDTVETFRDMVSGMHDTYLSSVSNRMNEVMKVLTIIATLFIPPTLIAGIYGMNFRYMPELDWRWGYPVVWLVMLAIEAAMLAFFRRRRWL
jgi:magnesium transporter